MSLKTATVKINKMNTSVDRVFVYWNLTKKVLSVKALDGSQAGRVVAHARKLNLRDVEFRVSEAGRKRVVETGHKTVHAGVVGTLDGIDGETTAAGDRTSLRYTTWVREDGRYLTMAKNHGRQVRYNPHRAPGFEADHGDGTREQWVRTERAEMVTMASQMARPVVLAFDPCAIPEAV